MMGYIPPQSGGQLVRQLSRINPRDIVKWGGIKLTGRDITGDLEKLTDILDLMLKYGNTGAYGAVSVGTTATVLRSANPDRRAFVLRNLGVNALYVGFDSAVDITTGFKIDPGDGLAIGFYTGDVYGISEGTSDVRYLEVLT